MTLYQNVALVKVSMCMKFHKIILNSLEIMTNLKFCTIYKQRDITGSIRKEEL